MKNLEELVWLKFEYFKIIKIDYFYSRSCRSVLFCKQIEHFPPRKPFLIYILIIKLQGDIIKHNWKRNILKNINISKFCLISEQSELDINNGA